MWSKQKRIPVFRLICWVAVATTALAFFVCAGLTSFAHGSLETTDLVSDPLQTTAWESYYYLLSLLLFLVALAIFLSGLDDLFVDICYWVRRFYRFLFYRHIYRPLTLAQLTEKPEQSVAIMVPAWHEADVIANMLETNMKLMQYENYIFFVGVYHNDPATISEVDQVLIKYPCVKKVVVPHDGPTCKADCLNWIIQAIFLYEKHTGREFSLIVMHDSEDVIHPYELSLFNYLTPRKDLIQLPVRCLETKWYDFIRGTYIDEFSEFHTKDMVVREALVGIVPSAGVSTCFSRRAIRFLCEENADQPFNTDSLTEDYDISYRLRDNKELQQIFVVFPICVEQTGNMYVGSPRKKSRLIPIATEELFPNRLWNAIRQRTRWNTGIFFQAASGQTWKGGFFSKYYFFRDRKGILTNIAMLPAYFLLVNYLFIWLGSKLLDLPTYVFDLPMWIVYANIFLLANRVFQRAYFTRYLYGTMQGLLSVFRIPVSNLLNFTSTARSIWTYGSHLATGNKIAWDKTTHEYPSLLALEQHYKKLGVVLIERKVINEEQLEQLLTEQQICHLPLGLMLVKKGILDEAELTRILGTQLGYAKGNCEDVDPETAMLLMPINMMQDLEIVPFNVTQKNILEVLVSRMPKPGLWINKITALGYAGINPYIVSDAEIHRLLNLVYRKQAGQNRLGEFLVQKNLITNDQLNAALAETRSSRVSLGRVLVSKQWVDLHDLLQILSEQTGYAVGNPETSVTPVRAMDILHPVIMLNHSIYPVSVDEATQKLTFFTAHAISDRAKLSLFDSGYNALEPLLVSDEYIEKRLEELQAFMTAMENALPAVSARRLGHHLLERQRITHSKLILLLEKQKYTDQRLGELLIAENILTTDELNRIIAELGISCVSD